MHDVGFPLLEPAESPEENHDGEAEPVKKAADYKDPGKAVPGKGDMLQYVNFVVDYVQM